ncbi:MAG: P27 family phage terminase small subunit [Rubrivivax sp.]
MEADKLAVAPGESEAAGVPARADAQKSPPPPPLIELDERELEVYAYICQMLREAGIEHFTAGMPIAVIVRTYAAWLDACAKCEKDGRYQTAQSGWASPTPWAGDESRLKMELSQWLPKACLTIPSLTRVRKDTGQGSGQDDLFADLVAHATSSPSGKSPH